MNTDKKTLFIPLLIIALGMGWLLTTLKVAPGIDWVWTLSLAAVGVVTLFVGGIDKVNVVLGPLFIAAGSLSLLRQTNRISLDVEVPILIILAGVLLLIARLPAIPAPPWLLPNSTGDQQSPLQKPPK